MRFRTSSRAALTCGFVFRDGTESRTPCDAVGGQADVTLLPAESAQPMAFYIAAPTTADVVQVDDVQIFAR